MFQAELLVHLLGILSLQAKASISVCSQGVSSAISKAVWGKWRGSVTGCDFPVGLAGTAEGHHTSIRDVVALSLPLWSSDRKVWVEFDKIL